MALLSAAGISALSVVSSPLSHSFSRLSFSRTETLTSAASLSVSAANSSLSLPLLSPTTTSPSSLPLVYCGRGDKKTAKGKRFKHSFGNARPRNKKKGRGPPRVAAPPAPPKKDKFDDGQIVKIDIDESLFS